MESIYQIEPKERLMRIGGLGFFEECSMQKVEGLGFFGFENNDIFIFLEQNENVYRLTERAYNQLKLIYTGKKPKVNELIKSIDSALYEEQSGR